MRGHILGVCHGGISATPAARSTTTRRASRSRLQAGAATQSASRTGPTKCATTLRHALAVQRGGGGASRSRSLSLEMEADLRQTLKLAPGNDLLEPGIPQLEEAQQRLISERQQLTTALIELRCSFNVLALLNDVFRELSSQKLI